MRPRTARSADQNAVEEIGILFFECCLALDIALRAARDLVHDPSTPQLKLQLQELTRLLEICDGGFTQLTEKLDIAFYVRGDEPD